MLDTQTDDSNSEPRAQSLAELRARREALEEHNQQRAMPSEAEQIELESRALEDAEALAKLLDSGEKIGRTIQVLRTDLGLIVIKRCAAAKYRKFQDAGKFDTLDFEKLVRPQVVYPSLDRFDRMLDEQPMLVMHLGNALGELAGIKREALEKK